VTTRDRDGRATVNIWTLLLDKSGAAAFSMQELLRAADSGDPDVKALAWAMLAKGVRRFRRQ
jgi:hypothetical protein